MSRLASSRFRRRAAWFGSAFVIVCAVAFIGIYFSNTGHRQPEKFTAGKPMFVPKAPKATPVTAAEEKQVRAVAVRFIESAVYRKNVGDSFELTTSELRAGLSRSEWANGTIPVVPYPADAVQSVRWKLDYSNADEVALKVAFYPKPSATIERQVFEISLQNHGSVAAPHWLVSYWAPSGGAQISRADPRAPPVEIAPPKPPLGAIWLFLPIGVIAGGLLGVVIFLAIRGRVRHKRAIRAAQLYRSSSSPS